MKSIIKMPVFAAAILWIVTLAGCASLGDWVADKADQIVQDKAIPAVLSGLDKLGNKLEKKVDDDVAEAIKKASEDGLTKEEIITITKTAVGTEVQDVVSNVLLRVRAGEDLNTVLKEEGKQSGVDLLTALLLALTGPAAYAIKNYGESKKAKELKEVRDQSETDRRLLDSPAPIKATQNIKE